MTDIKQVTESNYFRAILGILGCLIAAAIIFAAGVHVGERRARYSYAWGANYENNFIGGPRGMMGAARGQGGPMGVVQGFQGRDFRNGHGVSGTVASVNGNNIVVKDNNGNENTVAVGDNTIIKSGGGDIKITDIKNGQKVVIIGNPGDNGVVNADLIRVFDSNSQPSAQNQQSQSQSQSQQQPLPQPQPAGPQQTNK